MAKINENLAQTKARNRAMFDFQRPQRGKSMCRRIQRKRMKGYKMPPNTKSVARPGKFGNPYKVGIDGTAQECVAKFRAAIDRSDSILKFRPEEIVQLRGFNLACFCGLDEPCHADALIQLANKC